MSVLTLPGMHWNTWYPEWVTSLFGLVFHWVFRWDHTSD